MKMIHSLRSFLKYITRCVLGSEIYPGNLDGISQVPSVITHNISCSVTSHIQTQQQPTILEGALKGGGG